MCRNQHTLHDSWSWHNIVKQLTGQELPTPSVVKSKQTFNDVALWLVLLLHSIEVTDSNHKHIFSVRFCNYFSKMLANIRIVSFLLFSQYFTFNPHVIPHLDIYNQGRWWIVVQYTVRLLIYLFTYSMARRPSEIFGLLFLTTILLYHELPNFTKGTLGSYTCLLVTVSNWRHVNWRWVFASFDWTLDTMRQKLVDTWHQPSIHLKHCCWYCGLSAHRHEHAIPLNKMQYKGNWYYRVVHPLRSFRATARDMCCSERDWADLTAYLAKFAQDMH